MTTVHVVTSMCTFTYCASAVSILCAPRRFIALSSLLRLHVEMENVEMFKVKAYIIIYIVCQHVNACMHIGPAT